MIHFSFPKAGYLKHKEEIDLAVKDVLLSDIYIKGSHLNNFEKNFSNYVGSDYAIGVGNGTDALLLSLLSLDIQPGDQVLTVSHTATGTASAIIQTGAIPVFVDIDPATYTIDIDDLKKKITKETKAIICVHLYGHPCNMDELLSLSLEKKIPLIEDCAQSAGAEYNDKKVGSLGKLGCFSFFPTKNLSGIGDGGMVTTNDKDLFDKIISMREYGWNKDRDSYIYGINSRLDELQAAILDVKLKYLEKDNEERRSIAEYYKAAMTNTPAVLPYEDKKSKHVFHLFVIRVEKRENLIESLRLEGINPGIHYPNPVHTQTFFKRYKAVGLTQTDLAAQTVLSLPIYQGLTDQEVKHCADSVCKHLK